MNRQEYYRQRYQALQPAWRNSLRLYQRMVEQYANHSDLLDIGCGHGNILERAYALARRAVGLEPDLAALQRNSALRWVAQGAGETLPFASNSFDLICSAWVFEHIQFPQALLGELARVLRPGGRVVFLTPNAWNYNVWLIRAVPNRWHTMFTRRLYQRTADDTYPVAYRLNSPRRLERLFHEIGFACEQLVFNGDPSYISFNEPLFRLAHWIERQLDQPWLQPARVHLLGAYRKVA